MVLLLVTKHETVAVRLELAALLVTPCMIHWEMGGYAASGGMVIWALLAPLRALVFLGTHSYIRHRPIEKCFFQRWLL